ncbi:hypothetical protein K474DRAFT_1665732 [Panus rudis PR-1116 ss-1]|nr:hypothetical protein K474DRAFT_1665732 [Panus rudis PR-1116 ss-1]
MSYADVAAHNAPPKAQQPHPDPALFTTEPPSASNIIDDAAKLNVVAPDAAEHPVTVTSANRPVVQEPETPSSRKQTAKDKARRYAHEAEEEGWYLWNTAKHYLFRPAIAGGLLGLVNVGLISGAGYAFYTQPHLRRDKRLISSTVAGALALFGAEGYLAEKYRETPAGQEEERKAREEGAALYRVAKEHILRPGVLGGLVGVLNAGILGTLGYFAYLNWNAPRWDRRTVSAITVSLLALWTGEGYVAEQYRKKNH